MRVTGGQIRGWVTNPTPEPLLYTPLYLERYHVWARRWEVVRIAPAPVGEARLSTGAQAEESLAAAEARLLEPGHYRVCVRALPRSAWSLLSAVSKRQEIFHGRRPPRPGWPVTCAALWEQEEEGDTKSRY